MITKPEILEGNPSRVFNAIMSSENEQVLFGLVKFISSGFEKRDAIV